MYKFLIGLYFICFAVSNRLIAQILPQEDKALNYRIIGFSFPKGEPGCKYKIEIATGSYNREEAFKKHITCSFTGDKNKIIGEVPAFGKEYTWRSIIVSSDNSTKNSELHHFSTLVINEVDTSITRFRVLKNAEAYKDHYVFLDGTRALYDMNGQPVWYLPIKKDTTRKELRNMFRRSPWGALTFLDNGTRDLKLSSRGTVTLLDTNKMYEVNYNGDVIWRGPKIDIKDSIQSIIGNYHHHEFTRLDDGNYMSLGSELVSWELPADAINMHIVNSPRSPIVRDSITHKTYQRILTGRIVEYDPAGNIIWTWKSSDYLIESDLYNRRRPNGVFKLKDTHENAFYFDEPAKKIYVSFRNMNRILELDYPSGKTVNTYGTLFTPGDLELNNGIFCGQHCVMHSMDGYIYMYNNNSCNFPCQLPTVLMIQNKDAGKDTLEKIWEYQCTIDSSSMTTEELSKLRFAIGGAVFELPDRSIFCCMGGNYSKVFIVNRNKELLWSAIPEVWNKTDKKWDALMSYRASIISREDLERFIWGETSE